MKRKISRNESINQIKNSYGGVIHKPCRHRRGTGARGYNINVLITSYFGEVVHKERRGPKMSKNIRHDLWMTPKVKCKFIFRIVSYNWKLCSNFWFFYSAKFLLIPQDKFQILFNSHVIYLNINNVNLFHFYICDRLTVDKKPFDSYLKDIPKCLDNVIRMTRFFLLSAFWRKKLT